MKKIILLFVFKTSFCMAQSPAISDTTNMFLKGQSDAKLFYKTTNGAAIGTFGVGLLSPLVGLIPAIATTVKPPKEMNLDFPNALLFSDAEYKRGYISKAKKIKQTKVWSAWGVTLGLGIIVQTIKQSNKENTTK